METDTNPKQKRKGSSSTEEPTSKKKPDKTTAKKPATKPVVPTNIDNDSLLGAAAAATKYACDLVEGLADEFYHEDQIGACMSKVAKALEQVCKALHHLTTERASAASSHQHQPIRRDAATSTDLHPPTDLNNAPQAPKAATASNASNNNPSASRRRSRRGKAAKKATDNRTPTGAPTARDKTTPPAEPTKLPENHRTEPEEAPFTLVEKATRKPPASRPQPPRKNVQRPAALLVKVSEGMTYADTLRAVRGTAIDFEAMGTHVTAMRKTLKGDLLVELTKGAKATAATSVIRDKLAESMTGSVVTRLRHTAEVEITDLDEVATKEEVLTAIRKAIRDDQLPSENEISITGLWATREGRQMATATVPIEISRTLTFIRVGWTQCRVRPRRQEPAKCYQCHGFGHSTRQCTGPDLSHACRRCGENGHTQATCEKGEDHCVACDRMKAPRIPHKPGSGACAARRKAIAEMNASNNRK